MPFVCIDLTPGFSIWCQFIPDNGGWIPWGCGEQGLFFFSMTGVDEWCTDNEPVFAGNECF